MQIKQANRPTRRPRGMRALQLAASAAALAANGAAWADVLQPSDLLPGQQYTYVFITQATTTASGTTIADYQPTVDSDVSAQSLGTLFGQSVTWKPLISTADGTNAIDLFDPSVPIYRLDGQRVADSGADLWDGSIQNSLSIDSTGATSTATGVWTGTAADGSGSVGMTGPKALGSAQGLPFNGTFAEAGNPVATDGTWIDADSELEAAPFPVYAFSTVLAVPEPASAALVAGALLAAAAGRRRG